MNIDCKMLIDESIFEEFQKIAFSLGYSWVNQTPGENKIVSKSDTGIGIIMHNKRIYGAYGTSPLSSWSQSNADIVQMHQFVRQHRKDSKTKTTISTTLDKVIGYFSKLADKDGNIELPKTIAKQLDIKE